jgi:acyl-CoA dehydrogenase
VSSAIDRGRQDLLAWDSARPDDFFGSDPDLVRTLRLRLGEDFDAAWDRLSAVGRAAAGPVARAGREANREEQLPRLERWSPLGERIESVVFHPSYHESGRHVWASGVLSDYSEPGRETAQLAMVHLFAQNGEYGHACPLACTAGLIKILQAVGSDDQRARWLPGLLDRDYDRRLHASQFLTEVQGGSDVGANAVRAVRAEDGSWRIHGEKWFCSVIDASLFLMTARPEGAPEGTRGLGLFVVPRRRADGRTNDFRIRRLKWKLGTRAMASAEVDFEGAHAEAVGPLDRGFKNVVERVLDTSRVYNAICCAGSMRRAYVEALGYARSRRAFGHAIGRYPLIRETLATLRAEAAAAAAATLKLARIGDRLALGHGDDTTIAARRVGVNVNKYWTSVRNTQMVRSAMEVLGGNGAIESFSILPQLYRDAMVLESWEGTHNTLVEQVWRDARRLQLHAPFLAVLADDLARARARLPAEDTALMDRVERGVEALAAPWVRLAAGEGDQRWARRVVDQMAVAQALVALAEELAASPEDDGCRGAIALLAERDLRAELPPPVSLPEALIEL